MLCATGPRVSWPCDLPHFPVPGTPTRAKRNTDISIVMPNAEMENCHALLDSGTWCGRHGLVNEDRMRKVLACEAEIVQVVY